MKRVGDKLGNYLSKQPVVFIVFCVLDKNTKDYGMKISKMRKTIAIDVRSCFRVQLFIIKTQHLLKHLFKTLIHFFRVYTHYRKRIFVYIIIFKIQFINANVNISIGTLQRIHYFVWSNNIVFGE